MPAKRSLKSRFSDSLGARFTPLALNLVLKGIGWKARFSKKYRSIFFHEIGNGREAWNARLLFKTRDERHVFHIAIANGGARAGRGTIDNPDAAFVFRNLECMKKMLMASPQASMEMLLRNDLTFDGNMAVVTRFSYFLERLFPKKPRDVHAFHSALFDSELQVARAPLKAPPCDDAPHLDDPSFSQWTLADFPRLHGFLKDFFRTKPAVATERARLMTDFFKEYGFERGPDGSEHDPGRRQAAAFKHLMANRQPIIREGDLIAGTTTEKDIGVVLYPDLGGVFLWPELYTVHARRLNPYHIEDEDRHLLNGDIYPFWVERNLREVARARANNPTCLRLDERFVFYFQWKAHALSHTIPNVPAVLEQGLAAISTRSAELQAACDDDEARTFYESVQTGIEGVLSYALHLSERAAALAAQETDPVRKAELEQLCAICEKVPAQPAKTLHEALNSIWITWVACHMENTNAGLSIGRLDKWLQPFLEADLERCSDDEERRTVIKRAVELVGCFFLRCTDHLPMVPDLGNKLFGGSSSDQVITIGGVLEDGENAVCDMTYIVLKVAEMLRLRDPNLNARYHPQQNSDAYLRRLCEVNALTGATPSIHNDQAVIAAVTQLGFTPEDARDWSATGCVEPTSCGRHFGHTNCMMFNLVAPLEMTLYNGYHPLCDEVIGPRTGEAETFDTFEQFYEAYLEQLHYLAEQSVECNNLFGETHRYVRPTPFLSTLIDDCLENGRDAVWGGARYNTSGTAMIALADVVDSLLAIKQLVYEEKRVEFATLLDALRNDFEGHEALHARVINKVPKFGSANPEPIRLAQKLINHLHDLYASFPHYRGGRYTTGFWSMSNHVAFGVLSGALPSGRRRGKPFTPGITPSPLTKDTLLQHIQTVAALDPLKMPNNIAFNVKVVPDPKDSAEEALSTMTAYAKTYLESGGMQMQFNVVSTDTLREAMEHPEQHRNLMVRISGYNAYFVELNRDLQLELIERTEHSLRAHR